MVQHHKLLTETEAQQIAERFLLGKYFESKVEFTDNQLTVKDDVQVYQLQGKIIMRSRGSLDRFTTPKGANKYDFKIQVNAEQGQILSYEFA